MVQMYYFLSTVPINQIMFHMNYVIEGAGALVNEAGEETALKAGDFALVNPSEKHQYRNKGDKPFKMICGVPKEFEWLFFYTSGSEDVNFSFMASLINWFKETPLSAALYEAFLWISGDKRILRLPL